MFASKKVVSNIIKTLGLNQNGEARKSPEPNPYLAFINQVWGEGNDSCSVGTIQNINEKISDVNKKLDCLFSYLKLEYQKNCREKLPKINKMKRKDILERLG
jgi:hypothetical protein